LSLFDELRHKPALSRSFWLTLVRFVITSLTSILASPCSTAGHL